MFRRRAVWDAQNLHRRRRTMPIWNDEPQHWPDCRVNCAAPRIGQTDECEAGHEQHWCNCDDVAAAYFERAAEAAAEHLSEVRQH